ncbi:ankyrin repeat-containing domain protein [Lasiosphaeris hirsuta]|uniref:Ankyrin repeat-containing domain protein n=1 Tax=Lasiosphaeris hirsuta TaxID=260670 RepID=A0AA40E3P5_9PEZI|nr:ankyrin repeat-containing domain protein [Lasiosphaeris hirsuta]
MGELNINAQDTYNATPLHWAALNRHEAIVSLLLKSAANVEVESRGGSTPLAWAIESGSKKSIRMLLVKASKVDYEYETPLLRAVEKQDRIAVQLLLENGAVPTLVCQSISPLAMARSLGDDSIVGLLKSYGAIR